MEKKTIIFNSEQEFRKYVILTSQDISRIVLFEDILECTIFFYGFFDEGPIIASKESMGESFSFYKNIYKQLAKKNKFHILQPDTNSNAILLLK